MTNSDGFSNPGYMPLRVSAEGIKHFSSLTQFHYNSGQRPYSSRRTQDETDRAGSLGCHRADSKQPYSDPSPATARTPTTKAERSHNPAQARSDRWRTDSPIAASGLPVQAAGLLPQTTVPNNDCDNDHAARIA